MLLAPPPAEAEAAAPETPTTIAALLPASSSIIIKSSPFPQSTDPATDEGAYVDAAGVTTTMLGGGLVECWWVTNMPPGVDEENDRDGN